MHLTHSARFIGIRFNSAAPAAHRRTAALVSLLLLNLLLSLFIVKPAQAADLAPLELSATSGPTGTVITLKGAVPADYAYLSLISIFVKPDPKANFYMRIGSTSVKPGGALSWSGPLPRAGLEYAGDGSVEPREAVLPKGPVAIVYGVVPSFESQPVIFTVTDNASGPYADPGGTIEIYNNWARTDSLVQVGAVSRSWLWGPTSYEVIEPYKEAPKGWRFVTYYDKARMEITNPAAPTANNPYFVTNGLLVREMVTGQLQLGNTTFETHPPANVPTAGDFSAENKTPDFAAYAPLQTVNPNKDGDIIVASLNHEGQVAQVPDLARYKAAATNLVRETNHFIASPFWDFLNSSGPIIINVNTADQAQSQGRIFDPLFSATGYPITEAYWTKTVVGGAEKDVLVQLFERRVLTYTPSNPAAYQVEMGNVGLQYYQWRYGAAK
jgi:hypothetical protein